MISNIQQFRQFMNTGEAQLYSGLGGFAARRVRGNGPPYIKIGGRVVYEKSAIDSWLRERTVNNTSEHSAAQAIAAADAS